MDVNTDVWGTPETWRVSGVYASCNAKLGELNVRDSYYAVWSNNFLDLNVIDKSVAYWGISKNSVWAKPHFISPFWTGSEIDVDTRPAYDNNADDIPAIFSTNQGYSQNDITYNNRYADVNTVPYNNGTVNRILLDFNYQKVVLVPCVLYVSSTSGTRTIYATSMKDYIDNIGTTYNNYRYVVGFGFRVRTGDTNRAQNYGLNLQVLRHFSGSDIYYQPAGTKYTYFATENGFDMISCGGYLGNSNEVSKVLPYSNIYGAYIDQTIGDGDTAFRAKYCVNYNAGGMIYNQVPVYFYDDNPLWKINKIWEGTPTWQQVFSYINITNENINDFKAYALKQIAYLGFIFVYDPDIAINGQLGDTGLYYPVFDANGITTGDYKDGLDAIRLPNSEWIDAREGSGYNPGVTPESDLDNVTGRNLNFWASSKYYLMTQDDLNKFLHVVNGLYTGGSTPEEKAEEVQNMQVDFKGSNPSDYIVALYGIPFQWVWQRTSFQPVMLGPVEILHNDVLSDTTVMQVNPDSDCTLLFGEISVPALGNFLDYAPYTKMMLYVPFVGTIDIDPVDYAGQTMRVEGKLDKQTGELAIRVMRNGATVTNTLTANLYIQIPITAQAMGNYENNLHQLQMAGFNRALGNLTGAVTGGVSIGAAAAASGDGGGGSTGGLSPTAPISMAANLISLPVTMADYDYRITHCQPSVFYSSSASSANQAKFYRKCKLFIKRPVMLSSYSTVEGKAAYAHTVGHACSIIGTIADSGISGFCQVGSIDLSGVSATVEEINAIKQALSKGVYV